MIRTISFFLALLLINNVNAQINDLPKLDLPIWYEWQCPLTDDTTQNVKTAKVGHRTLKYTTIGNKKLSEEFIGANQISKALVQHHFVTDTIVVWDSISNNFKIGYDSHFNDFPDGKYEEYWNDPFGLKCKGTFDHGKKIGKWIQIDINKNKIVANFNIKGNFDGLYQEFNYQRDSNSYTLKREGQFQTKVYTDTRKSASGRPLNQEVIECRRVGTWKYYSQDQKLLEVVDYKWVNK